MLDNYAQYFLVFKVTFKLFSFCFQQIQYLILIIHLTLNLGLCVGTEINGLFV